MRFICNLDVPRTETHTGVPQSWIDDHTVDLEVHGFLYVLLAVAEPGLVVNEADIPMRAGDRPVTEIVGECQRHGYLEARGDDLYELVHPGRLEPLPKV